MTEDVPVRHHNVLRIFAAAVVVSVGCSDGSASAQGIFNFLFGRPSNPSLATHPSPDLQTSRSPARVAPAKRPSRTVRRTFAFCVRLCDGRYFPIQSSRAATSGQMCGALCPAAPIKVFQGSEIGQAIASDGTRYAALDNAFVYRSRIVRDCTCNGRTHFGVKRIAITADPTLRTGDIVTTARGLIVVRGKSAGRSGTLLPIATARNRLTDIRQALASQNQAEE
jgi:Protein of unknown function (DUF2865)